jgi:hypothetical protein
MLTIAQVPQTLAIQFSSYITGYLSIQFWNVHFGKFCNKQMVQTVIEQQILLYFGVRHCTYYIAMYQMVRHQHQHNPTHKALQSSMCTEINWYDMQKLLAEYQK